MNGAITTKQIKDLYLNDQVITNIDIEQFTSSKEYLPLSGGTVSGDVKIDGTLSANNKLLVGDNTIAESSQNVICGGQDSHCNGSNQIAFGQNCIAGTNGFKITGMVENKETSTYLITVDAKGDEIPDSIIGLDYSLTLLQAATNIGKIISIDHENSKLEVTSSIPFTYYVIGFYIYFASAPHIGNVVAATGKWSTATGHTNKALGSCSHAEGYLTVAAGSYAHAEGKDTVASWGAHAEGCNTRALDVTAHSQGRLTLASGSQSFASGYGTAALDFMANSHGYAAIAKDVRSFTWNGQYIDGYADDASGWAKGDENCRIRLDAQVDKVKNGEKSDLYTSHGKGTFNINPENGLRGFYIGEKNLAEIFDYTAFEVFPTKEDIPAGTVSDVKFEGDAWDASTTFIKGAVVYHSASNKVYKCLVGCKGIEPSVTDGWEINWSVHDGFEGQYYKYVVKVPASATCSLRFYSYSKTREDCDILVDWGDGNISKVSDISDSSVTSFTNYEADYGSDYLYSNLYIKHTYSSENCGNKYIVKIYGKDYFMLRNNYSSGDVSIVSRVFSRDLPIASCLTNISSFCNTSKKLLQVKVPYGYDFKNCSNIGILFKKCSNLRYVQFPESKFSRISSFEGIVHSCPNLECDINNFKFIFRCWSDANDTGGFFNGDAKLYGTVDPYYFWQNPNILGKSNLIVSNCFAGCSDELRAQVPVSWGGINKDLDIQLQLKKLGVDTSDYTAFEVFPTNKEIPAGTISDTIVYGEYWESNTAYSVGSYILHKNQEKIYTCIKAVAKTDSIEPGVTEGWEEYWVEGNEHFDGYYHKYTTKVYPLRKIKLRLYSLCASQENCDLVIDWGDGNITRISDTTDKSITFYPYQELYGEAYRYSDVRIEHEYAEDACGFDITNGKISNCKKYIVKIYGNHTLLRSMQYDVDTGIKDSIVSRVFDFDLPISSSLTNFSSAFQYTKRLLQVIIPYGYKNLNNVNNFYYLFNDCDNLRYFNMSSGIIKNRPWFISAMFIRCDNLECDINNFNEFVINGSTRGSYEYMFSGCKKLYGTVNPKLYWESPWLNFPTTGEGFTNNNCGYYCFANTSDEIKSQVPKSWGGTKS